MAKSSLRSIQKQLFGHAKSQAARRYNDVYTKNNDKINWDRTFREWKRNANSFRRQKHKITSKDTLERHMLSKTPYKWGQGIFFNSHYTRAQYTEKMHRHIYWQENSASVLEAQQRLGRLLEGVDGMTDEFTYKAAKKLYNRIIEIVPVRSGRLRYSVRVDRIGKSSGAIYGFQATAFAVNPDTGEEYAIIQHENTTYKHQPGKTHHYISIPFNQIVNELEQQLFVNAQRIFVKTYHTKRVALAWGRSEKYQKALEAVTPHLRDPQYFVKKVYEARKGEFAEKSDQERLRNENSSWAIESANVIPEHMKRKRSGHYEKNRRNPAGEKINRKRFIEYVSKSGVSLKPNYEKQKKLKNNYRKKW